VKRLAHVLSGVLLGACLLQQMPMVFAQVPSAGQASSASPVTLSFIDADIESVVRAVGQFMGRPFLVDPRVQGKITVVSDQPVSANQALGMVMAALRLQGYAVVDVDGVLRVVPEADAKLQGGVVLARGTGKQSGELITQVFQLQSERAEALLPILRPLIAPNNPINANPGNNTLVITDYADNLRRIGQIIAVIDQAPAAEAEVIPVRHAIASDLAALVLRLLDGGVRGESAAGTATVVADPRSNSLLVRAPGMAQMALVKRLVAQLDRPGGQPGNMHVVYLRHAEARHVAEVLRGVLGGGVSPGSGADPASLSQGRIAPPNISTAAGGALGNDASRAVQPLPAASPLPGQISAGGAQIQADPSTNTLIITAPDAVYRNLRRVIDLLDVRRAQVFVESLIVEVTSDNAAEFGIQWMGNLDQIAGGNTVVLGGTRFGGAGSNIISGAQNFGSLGPGLNIGVVRGTVNVPGIGLITNLGVLARALETKSGTNILSTPNLLTLDNEPARIVIGQNVPIITGQFVQSNNQAGVTPFQTIERQDVGLTLEVKPQVMEGGTVRMKIYQEVSSIDERLTSNSGIVTRKRSIESNVLVDDGQIIVLGGLVQDGTTIGLDKVPGLGDIPVVGGLFRYENRKRAKTSLMVFLRPYVIRDERAEDQLVMDRYAFIRNAQLAARPAPHWLLPDIDGPTLPETLPPVVPPAAGTLPADVSTKPPQLSDAPGPVQQVFPVDPALRGPMLETGRKLRNRIPLVDMAAARNLAASLRERLPQAQIEVVSNLPADRNEPLWFVHAEVPNDRTRLNDAIQAFRDLGQAPEILTRP
jgi:general secretion pathway protein D